MARKNPKSKRLPEVCPRFTVGKDGDLEELSREEMTMIGFRRCLPDDLKPEFDKALNPSDTAFAERMREFTAKAHPRRDEIVAAGWTWWA